MTGVQTCALPIWLLRFARALGDAGFGDQATLFLTVNSGRLLAGEMPQPVPPMMSRAQAAAPWWKRLLG